MKWKHVRVEDKRFDTHTGEPTVHVTNWVRDERDNSVAIATAFFHDTEVAHARLIAAAPELREVVKFAIQGTPGWQKLAHEVLEKAGHA